MSLSRPTIVIFDMDGTTVRHLNPRLLHVLEWLDDCAFKISRLWKWWSKGGKGPIFVEGEIAPLKKTPKLIVHRVMHKFRRKPVEQIVEPCPGVYAVLDFLHKKNIPLGLTSNGLGKGYGHDVLQKFDLEKYFRATIFREDIRSAKPHPEGILLTLQKMDAALTDKDVVWYIGDRHKDITAVQNAAPHLPCPIVPIAYGLNAAVAVLEKNIGPEHIIMSFHDMLKVLERLFRA